MPKDRKSSGSSLRARSEAYKNTLKRTKSFKLAIRAYSYGNKWAEENARAVGNW